MVFYNYLKARGITDDHILLLLPENHVCNPRNVYPGQLYVDPNHEINLYCEDVEVDYKETDISDESILNMLRGRYENNFPESKKLKTNSESKIFIYFNGHGGDNFFKI